MFRLRNNLAKLVINAETINNNYIAFEIVRWRRKPRWLPVAKSKMFRIPQRPVTNTEETEEMKRLYSNYKTQIKSLRRYLTYKHCTRFMQKSDSQLQQKLFEEDFVLSNKLNDEWNAECKLIRERRIEENIQKDVEIAKKNLEERLKINSTKLEEAEEIVRREKDASKTFVTPENLDAVIEQALANPVDYNFSIDLNGNIYHGRETLAKQENEKTAVKQ